MFDYHPFLLLSVSFFFFERINRRVLILRREIRAQMEYQVRFDCGCYDWFCAGIFLFLTISLDRNSQSLAPAHLAANDGKADTLTFLCDHNAGTNALDTDGMR